MRIESFARAAEKAFNDRDVEAIVALWAEPAVYTAPGGQSSRGLDALRDREHELWTAFPDLRASMRVLGESGDTGALQVTFAGTHAGVFRDAAPTGRPIVFDFIGVFTFEGDKVVAERVFYDRLEIAQKLGG